MHNLSNFQINFILSFLLSLLFYQEAQSYCNPGTPPGFTSNLYLEHTSVGPMTTNLMPGVAGYVDLTSMGATDTLYRDSTYTFSFDGRFDGTCQLIPNGSGGSQVQSVLWGAWIDYSNDGIFDPHENLFAPSTGNNPYSSCSGVVSNSGTFTVPSAIPFGETRIRIVGRLIDDVGETIDPCGPFPDDWFSVDIPIVIDFAPFGQPVYPGPIYELTDVLITRKKAGGSGTAYYNPESDCLAVEIANEPIPFEFKADNINEDPNIPSPEVDSLDITYRIFEPTSPTTEVEITTGAQTAVSGEVIPAEAEDHLIDFDVSFPGTPQTGIYYRVEFILEYPDPECAPDNCTETEVAYLLFCAPGGRKTVQQQTLISKTSVAIDNIAPNPFSDNFKIDYTLYEQSAVHLMLANALGQVVFEQFLPTQSRGPHETRINIPDIPYGVYYLILETKKQKVSRIVNKMP